MKLKMPAIQNGLLTLGFLAVAVISQPAEVPGSPARKAEAKKQYDAIFEEMVSSLPEPAQARMDMATKVIKNKPKIPPGHIKDPDHPKNVKNKLPPQARKQVEIALENINKRRFDRKTEFKELKKDNKNKGKGNNNGKGKGKEKGNGNNKNKDENL